MAGARALMHETVANSGAKSRARFGCDLNLDTHMLIAAIMHPPETPLQRAYNP